ncbi:MAG: hydantoinase B/oxoprolinase family protein [Solirubrobacterales bacterium]
MTTRAALDPVTFEVIRHRLWAINDEQAMIAARMSGSPVIYEVYDFNAGILTAEGHGLVAGIYILHHAATIDFFVQKILAEWPREEIREGDMFFTNDPWCGALHSNDGVLVTPIFWQGEIVCWSGLAMHDEDVGSPVPGSFVVGARDRYGEAPLYPTVKMVEGFELRRDIESVFLRNSRTPDHNALNLRGRMASLTVTHRRVHELIADYGIETFRAATEEIVDYVEEVVRGHLREMPDGAWFHRIHLDHDGNENELYPICCRLSKQGDRLVVDFTGTAAQAPGAVNCARAALEGAVIGVFLMFLCYDLPWSVGAAHRVVEIVSAEGTINNALPPAATSMASISGTLATQAAVANAFAKMLLASDRFRGEAQAAWSSIPNCLVLAGLDRRGEPFATVDMNNCGGGAGARSFADGMDTGGIFHSMGSTIPNVETMESRTPELAVFRRQRADSAGSGRFRGGAGLELLLAPHKNPAPVDHITISAFNSQPDNCGIAGGGPAAVNSNVILRGTDLPALFAAGHVPGEAGEISGEREVIAAKARSEVAAGDAHLYLQTGGGGYGDPLRRDPEAVLVDLRHALVSAATAADVYGVVIAGDAVDAAATEARRERIRAERIAGSRPVREGAGEPRRVAGGEPIHPVADTVEAMRVDGEALIRCTVCATRLGGYEDDYKAATLWRERPFTALGELNAVAPRTPLRAREYCCPGCGTLLAVDIGAVGEPPLAECAFGAGAAVPAGGFMELGNDAVEEVR